MTTNGQRAGNPGWNGIDGLMALRSRLHDWAGNNDRVLAAVAFGSTERLDRPADQWSDLDLLIVVEDADEWLDDLSWLDTIDSSWVRLVNDGPQGIRVVQVMFEGGYDVDLIPVDAGSLALLLDPSVAGEVFGHGARIVADPGGAFAVVSSPDGSISVAAAEPSVRPPTREAFDHVVSTFLYQTVWATKRLRRGELWRAHDDVDDYMRDRLLTMLEWHALARGIAGVYPESRRLEAWVPPDVAEELPATFAAYDETSIARALVTGHALFRRLAREVAAHWGFLYPDDDDAAIEAWVAQRLADLSDASVARPRSNP